MISAKQLIAEVVASHPAELRREAMKQAEVHNLYCELKTTRDAAYKAANRLFQACLTVYDCTGFGDVETILEEPGTTVVAANIAAKLRGIHHSNIQF